jgi:hypothetical protein
MLVFLVLTKIDKLILLPTPPPPLTPGQGFSAIHQSENQHSGLNIIPLIAKKLSYLSCVLCDGWSMRSEPRRNMIHCRFCRIYRSGMIQSQMTNDFPSMTCFVLHATRRACSSAVVVTQALHHVAWH